MTDAYKENYKLIDWSVPLPEVRREQPRGPRSSIPCPMIISDNICLRSMVDGQMYTSKRALRQSYREQGYIEIGDQEHKPFVKPKPDRKAIRESVKRGLSQAGLGALI